MICQKKLIALSDKIHGAPAKNLPKEALLRIMDLRRRSTTYNMYGAPQELALLLPLSPNHLHLFPALDSYLRHTFTRLLEDFESPFKPDALALFSKIGRELACSDNFFQFFGVVNLWRYREFQIDSFRVLEAKPRPCSAFPTAEKFFKTVEAFGHCSLKLEELISVFLGKTEAKQSQSATLHSEAARKANTDEFWAGVRKSLPQEQVPVATPQPDTKQDKPPTNPIGDLHQALGKPHGIWIRDHLKNRQVPDFTKALGPDLYTKTKDLLIDRLASSLDLFSYSRWKWEPSLDLPFLKTLLETFPDHARFAPEVFRVVCEKIFENLPKETAADEIDFLKTTALAALQRVPEHAALETISELFVRQESHGQTLLSDSVLRAAFDRAALAKTPETKNPPAGMFGAFGIDEYQEHDMKMKKLMLLRLKKCETEERAKQIGELADCVFGRSVTFFDEVVEGICALPSSPNFQHAMTALKATLQRRPQIPVNFILLYAKMESRTELAKVVSDIALEILSAKIHCADPRPLESIDLGAYAMILQNCTKSGIDIAEHVAVFERYPFGGLEGSIWPAVMHHCYHPLLETKSCIVAEEHFRPEHGLPLFYRAYITTVLAELQPSDATEFAKAQDRFFAACTEQNKGLDNHHQLDLAASWDDWQDRIIQLGEIFGGPFAFGLLLSCRAETLNPLDQFLSGWKTLDAPTIDAVKKFAALSTPKKEDYSAWKNVVKLAGHCMQESIDVAEVARDCRTPKDFAAAMNSRLIGLVAKFLGVDFGQTPFPEFWLSRIGDLLTGLNFLRKHRPIHFEVLTQLLLCALKGPDAVQTFLYEGKGDVAVHNQKIAKEMKDLGVDTAKFRSFPTTQRFTLPVPKTKAGNEQDDAEVLAAMTSLSTCLRNQKAENLAARIEKNYGHAKSAGKNSATLSRLLEAIRSQANQSQLEKKETDPAFQKVSDAITKAASKTGALNMVVRQIENNPVRNIFLGAMVGCCISPTNQRFYAMVERLFDAAMTTIEVVQEDTGITQALVWLFLMRDTKGQVRLVANFHEMNAPFAKSPEHRKSMMDNLTTLTKAFARHISADASEPIPYNLRQLNYGVLPKFEGLSVEAVQGAKVGGNFRDLPYFLEAPHEFTLLRA